eukprot:CAMPEP_0180691364 /NCGR_PEP_ID=MMETSP1038_2-20121128/197_1 /TAXON_ID=632150 /ORGANISM="Azadinium spinosum, Strain 3D9" /LENGTH=197 /DNA_ID=CAMNT_0022722353 /DNA_START=63 /DNA_END=656 /DNA_ORIENTATION=-
MRAPVGATTACKSATSWPICAKWPSADKAPAWKSTAKSAVFQVVGPHRRARGKGPRQRVAPALAAALPSGAAAWGATSTSAMQRGRPTPTMPADKRHACCNAIAKISDLQVRLQRRLDLSSDGPEEVRRRGHTTVKELHRLQRGHIVAIVRRSRAVGEEQALVAQVICLAHRGAYTDVGGDTCEDQIPDAVLSEDQI